MPKWTKRIVCNDKKTVKLYLWALSRQRSAPGSLAIIDTNTVGAARYAGAGVADLNASLLIFANDPDAAAIHAE